MAGRWRLNLSCFFSPGHTVTILSFFPHTQETALQVLLQKLLDFSKMWVACRFQHGYPCLFNLPFPADNVLFGVFHRNTMACTAIALLNYPLIMCFREILCRCSVMPAEVHKCDGLGLDCSERKVSYNPDVPVSFPIRAPKKTFFPVGYILLSSAWVNLPEIRISN